MKRLVSKKRSTQLTRQLSSPRENRVEGVPVMHLGRKNASQVSKRRSWEDDICERTHLSQHMLVKVWMDCCRRACACSRSRKLWSSFCSVGGWERLGFETNKNERHSHLGGIVKAVGHGVDVARRIRNCRLGALGQKSESVPSLAPSVFSGYMLFAY